MSELRESGAPLEERIQALQLLHDLGRRITSILDIGQLLPEMVDQLRQVMRVEIVSVMLIEDGGETLRVAAASGLPGDVIETARVKLGVGISGQVASRGEPVLIRDVRDHAEFTRSSYASQYTTESLLCVPLRIGDRVLGVINVNNKLSGQPLDDDDLALVTTFSAQAALAIENSRLYGNLEAEVARVTRELQESNRELRRLTEFSESILRNMSSGLLALDLGGHVVKLNDAGAAMLDLRPDEVMGLTLGELFGEDAASRIRSEPETPPAERREMLARAPGGRELLLGFSTSPLLEMDGRRAGVIVIFRDLTRLKKMELELVRMDRMARLGVLGAGIAHEIRNPLAAMRFNLDFLAESGEPRPEIDVIRKNIQRLDDLVRKLLRFARPQQPAFETQALEARVEGVVSLIAAQAAASGVLITRGKLADVPEVRIDGPQIEQVILNIALNAIQHMPAGGELRLETRVAARAGDRHVELRISDEGPGLSEELARQIFDPFFTTRKEGTGLGLAVAHRIMDDHGGYLETAPPPTTAEILAGERLRGATFVIGFPLPASAPAETRSARRTSRPAGKI